ncbi:MAG: chromosomal replication initiator protein DnaA [Alphaproteobacteria bacterium]|nr:chromosomal replication initiator protein DnaA [Alphaproteobacteria bacterium]
MITQQISETVHPLLTEQWRLICEKLTQDLGDAAFKSWIKPLELISVNDESIFFNAPSRFMKDWILAHYSENIQKYWKEVLPNLKKIEIGVNASKTSYLEVISEDSAQGVDEIIEGIDDNREDMSAALDSRFTFENFVVGKPNELAYAAALRVAESDTPLFNPLFLYGGVGLGKTHLMHAIAWHIKKTHPTRKVIYLSAEKFMYQFIRALRFKDTVAFKDEFRNVDVLMIDDVQFISGKDTTQEEFFHTFNALVDNNRQVIISADKSPADLEKMEERLKSRLGWGLVADIHPTTYELRLGILQAKADALGLKIPKDVMEFLAFRIISNIRELEGALNRIVAHATLVGRNISIDTTQEVLRDLLRSNDRRITIEDIQKRVCEFYNIKISDLLSSRRLQNIARPRQIAIYLSKLLTSKSLPEIGRKFGGRDHTTVLHSVRKVQEFCQSDREFANDIDILRRSLEA